MGATQLPLSGAIRRYRVLRLRRANLTRRETSGTQHWSRLVTVARNPSPRAFWHQEACRSPHSHQRVRAQKHKARLKKPPRGSAVLWLWLSHPVRALISSIRRRGAQSHACWTASGGSKQASAGADTANRTSTVRAKFFIMANASSMVEIAAAVFIISPSNQPLDRSRTSPHICASFSIRDAPRIEFARIDHTQRLGDQAQKLLAQPANTRHRDATTYLPMN